MHIYPHLILTTPISYLPTPISYTYTPLGHGEDNNWKDHWTVDALWEMTYFMIFVAIAIMWAPSKSSMRYVR